MMQWCAHWCSCNSSHVLLHISTWVVGSKITFYQHLFLYLYGAFQRLEPIIHAATVYSCCMRCIHLCKLCWKLWSLVEAWKPSFILPLSPPTFVLFSVEKSHSFGWWRGERYVPALETQWGDSSWGNIDIRTSPDRFSEFSGSVFFCVEKMAAS